MTNNEAIRVLISLQEPEPWESQITEKAYDALEMAIEALKKQEPMKPKMPLDAYFVCPVCRIKINMYSEYCKKCGQSLGRWWEHDE